jgi:hypothetical protein
MKAEHLLCSCLIGLSKNRANCQPGTCKQCARAHGRKDTEYMDERYQVGLSTR